VENLKQVFDKVLKVKDLNKDEKHEAVLSSFSLLDKEGTIG
jgi:ATP-dependent Lon protease